MSEKQDIDPKIRANLERRFALSHMKLEYRLEDILLASNSFDSTFAFLLSDGANLVLTTGSYLDLAPVESGGIEIAAKRFDAFLTDTPQQRRSPPRFLPSCRLRLCRVFQRVE